MRCKTALEAKGVSDMAKAAEVYARRQKLSEETVQYAHWVHIVAKTLLGGFLENTDRNKGGNPTFTTPIKRRGVELTLKEIGISYQESSDARLLSRAARSKDPEMLIVYEGIKVGKKSERHIRRILKRQEHAAKVSRARRSVPAKTDGPYQLVLADPPWRYEHCEADNREIENQYGTASLEQIFKQSPNTTDDSILFLWATAPKLEEALQTMKAWGFSYRTCAVWDKTKIGMGYWWRIQHELLLVGVKGSPGCTPECERVSSIFVETRGHHSAKPICVYKWIERAFPTMTKLEMYCRNPRSGWSSWGNEI